MIKKYIKGNAQRGAEVIKALEELGGKNKVNLNGEDCNCLYYIGENNVIEPLHKSFFAGKLVQECFEEIKLPEKLNIAIKEPKQIYWFRATKDDTKNQALLDKLFELSGHSDISLLTSRKSCIYFNELDRIVCYDIDNKLSRMVMMIGKELVIDSFKDDTKYIDLGLPSGTLWAVWNVGANRPEEYGDYFEFEKWDSSLQVPTKEEFEELKKECKWEWTSVNGKQGHVVTGHNGKSIFLPAAGYRYGSSLYYAGEYGFYWSSTLRENDDYRAYDLTFNSSVYKVDWYCRLYRQGLRCVKRKRQ